MPADYRNVALHLLPDNPDIDGLASRNFTVRELSRSETADREGIENRPGKIELIAAVHLARTTLQPIRDHYDTAFRPRSLFRSQALERFLQGRKRRWVSRSQHTRGQAVDFKVPGVTNREVAQWVVDNLEFDRVVLERVDPTKGPDSGWVHVSRTGCNRAKILTYVKRDGKFVYVPGLVDS